MDRFLTRLTAAIALVLAAGPAFATTAVPEPATMSLFGVGVAGLIIARRFRRRK